MNDRIIAAIAASTLVVVGVSIHSLAYHAKQRKIRKVLAQISKDANEFRETSTYQEMTPIEQMQYNSAVLEDLMNVR